MAVRFDAVGDHLTRTANLPAYPLTVMAWFYLSVDRNAGGNVFWLHNSGTSRQNLYLESDGTTLGLWNNLSAVTGGSVTAGQWAHLAITVGGISGGGTLLAYKDGAQVISSVRNNDPYNTLRLMSDGTDWCNGRLAAVKVYGAALTAAEIAQEMRQLAPSRLANLNGFYPLWGSGDVGDYSGSANAWTVGGTLATEDGPPVPWRVAGPRLYRAVPVTASGTTKPGRQFSSSGSFAWSNPFNAAASDDGRATVTIGEFDTGSGLGVSQPLIATNFGFSLPSGATVNGVVVNIEGSTNIAGGDCFVELTKTGTAGAGTGKQVGLTTSESVIAKGTSSDLWSTTWTAAEINAPTFGIRLYGQCFEFQTSRTHSVDHVTVTVHYGEAGSTASATASSSASATGASFGVAAASSSGVGAASGVGSSTAASPASSSGIAAASGVGASTAEASAASSGAGAAAGAGASTADASGSSSGAASVSGAGASTVEAAGSSAGSASPAATGASTAAAAFASAGTSSADAAAEAGTTAADGSSSGVAAASGVGASTAAASASSSGSASADGVALAVLAAVFSSSGVGAATGVGAAQSEAAGASAGSAAGSGVGAPIYAGAFSSAGAAAGSGVGASTAEAAFSSSGAASVSGVAEPPEPGEPVEGVGSSAGVASASWVGASTGAGVFSAAGVAVASAVSSVTAASPGSSSGSSSASWVGASTAEAAFSSAGAAVASAVGDDAQNPYSNSRALLMHAG